MRGVRPFETSFMTNPINLYAPPDSSNIASPDIQPSPPEKLGLSERGIGVFALSGSSVFIYLGIIRPLLSVFNREPTVTIGSTSAVIAPMVFCLGVTYTILGGNAERYSGPRNRPSTLGWVFYVSTFVIGICVYQAVRYIIRQHCYNI